MRPDDNSIVEGFSLENLKENESENENDLEGESHEWSPYHFESRPIREPESDTDLGPIHNGAANSPSLSSFSSYRTIQSSVVTSNSISDSVEEHLNAVDTTNGGMVGLRNLGNTCFLNSTLQCLLAADELSLFLSVEANENRIDQDKALTLTLGKLFSKMWNKHSGCATSTYGTNAVDPRAFKYALGGVDHRFEGYRQEDSQEALAIILDRLHEDLKKSHHETLDESSDGDGWMRYCNKEDSIVRRLFHGQLRSTLTCPRCGHDSQTFDPFCFLNLPFPQSTPAVNKERKVKAKPLRAAFYNDLITGVHNANLKVCKSFPSLRDFMSHFAGGLALVVKLHPNGTVDQYHTKLSNVDERFLTRSALAYRLEVDFMHFIISLRLPDAEDTGFPIKVSLPYHQSFSLKAFVQLFFGDTLLRIVRYKFPERLGNYDEILAQLLQQPEVYFKMGQICTVNPLVSALDIEVVDENIRELLFGSDLKEFFDNFVDESEADTDEEDEAAAADDGDGGDGAFSFGNGTNFRHPFQFPHQLPSSRYPPEVSLDDCINAFLKEEVLSAKCENCNTFGPASKKLDLWRLPPLLILHLKRFCFSSGSGFGSHAGSKIGSRVEFPVAQPLTLTPLFDGTPVQYELFAVSQHFGNLWGGHYTATVWHRGQRCWCLADDSSFTRLSSLDQWVDGAKSAGYVLFYRLLQE